MAIFRCALAVITDRGKSIYRPVLSDLDQDEDDFLGRHVDELRSAIGDVDARGRPLPDSSIVADCQEMLTCSDDRFLELTTDYVGSLADAMKPIGNAPDCVVAILATGGNGAEFISILKLDAEIEAAHLEETERGGIRIRVFQDLLPRPGDLQKGISWPDPRLNSEVIVLDLVKQGSAAKYFQRAVGVEASPAAKETEAALLKAMVHLSADRLKSALEAAAEGGSGDDVVKRIKEKVPYFSTEAEALGAGGGLAGPIRPGFAQTATRTYAGDGFEIKVRLDKVNDINTEPFGQRYRTTIITDAPIVPKDVN